MTHIGDDLIRKYVTAHGPKVVLEVGAHVGDMTERWLAAGAETVLALEPTPHLYQAHVKRFTGDDRVTTLQLAASDFAKTEHNLNLYNCYTLLPQDTDIQLERSAPYKETPPFDVTFTTLDQLCWRRSYWPDFVKIDVDGYESRVMRGATQLFTKCRPLCLFELSYLPELIGDCCECMLRRIFGLGYRIRSTLTDEIWTDVKSAMRRFPWDTSYDVLLEPISP